MLKEMFPEKDVAAAAQQPTPSEQLMLLGFENDDTMQRVVDAAFIGMVMRREDGAPRTDVGALELRARVLQVAVALGKMTDWDPGMKEVAVTAAIANFTPEGAALLGLTATTDLLTDFTQANCKRLDLLVKAVQEAGCSKRDNVSATTMKDALKVLRGVGEVMEVEG